MGYFVKEVLRYDCPAITNQNQMAFEDVDLGDVVIKKGTDIRYNVFGVHYNKKQWIRPHEFLPERFDPTSNLFKRPDGGKRSKFAYIPFTFGNRACPG